MTEEQADEIIGLLKEIRDEVKEDSVTWDDLGEVERLNDFSTWQGHLDGLQQD